MFASKFVASALLGLASVAATSAFAGNDSAYPDVQVASSYTRAAVQAQVAQARQDGRLRIGNDKQYPVVSAISTKTRAEVKAEYLSALKAGEIVRDNS